MTMINLGNGKYRPSEEIEFSLRVVEIVKKRLKHLNQWLIDNDKHEAYLHDLYKINWSERHCLLSLLEK